MGKVKFKLKYPNSLPLAQEIKLVHEGGFYVWARQKGPEGWVIFAKDWGRPSLKKMEPPSPPAGETPPSRNFEVLVNGELEDSVKDVLNRQIKNIVALYLDPDAYQLQIRRRLERVCGTLPKHQAKYVAAWMRDNLDEEEPIKGTILRRAN